MATQLAGSDMPHREAGSWSGRNFVMEALLIAPAPFAALILTSGTAGARAATRALVAGSEMAAAASAAVAAAVMERLPDIVAGPEGMAEYRSRYCRYGYGIDEFGAAKGEYHKICGSCRGQRLYSGVHLPSRGTSRQSITRPASFAEWECGEWWSDPEPPRRLSCRLSFAAGVRIVGGPKARAPCTS
jgi:hypothetical protein